MIYLEQETIEIKVDNLTLNPSILEIGTIELKLNDITNLIRTNAPSDYDFESAIQLIDVSLLVDYIYLDVDERSKFAQSEQECLIEVVQNYNYNSINSNSLIIESYFTNSVKEMFWIAQSNNNISLNFLDTYDIGIIYQVKNISKIITNNNIEQKIQILLGNHIFNIGDIIEIFNSKNYSGIYKIIGVDLTTVTIYSKFYINELDCFVKLKTTSILTDSNNSNPFINTTYTFEQYNRFQNYNIYTNYVQPWQFHTKTPANGINSYSFAIQPEEYQPSGSVNLSNYKYKSFQFTLDNKLINYIKNNNDTLTIKTYALSYNIISLKNGMVGLVFNI